MRKIREESSSLDGRRGNGNKGNQGCHYGEIGGPIRGYIANPPSNILVLTRFLLSANLLGGVMKCIITVLIVLLLSYYQNEMAKLFKT